MSATLIAAFGLMLVFEGLIPFAAPKVWRETFQRMINMSDGQLRFIGLLSMLGGLVLVFLSR